MVSVYQLPRNSSRKISKKISKMQNEVTYKIPKRMAYNFSKYRIEPQTGNGKSFWKR